MRVKLHIFLAHVQMKMGGEVHASVSLDALYTNWAEG
jgi:hypothetical protein